MSLSKFLKKRREDVGLSQGQVAKFLGYTSPQFVSNWERGISKPPLHSLKELCGLYKTPRGEMAEQFIKESTRQIMGALSGPRGAK